jgi:hypothetical protein
VRVDTAGVVGSFTSLTVINGNPAISYFDNTNITLKYVHATDPNGTACGTPLSVDNTNGDSSETSLAIVNGQPAIAYFDQDGQVKFVRQAPPAFTIDWIALEP